MLRQSLAVKKESCLYNSTEISVFPQKEWGILSYSPNSVLLDLKQQQGQKNFKAIILQVQRH